MESGESFDSAVLMGGMIRTFTMVGVCWLVGYLLASFFLPEAKVCCPKCGNEDAKPERINFVSGKKEPNICIKCGYEWTGPASEDEEITGKPLLGDKQSPVASALRDLVLQIQQSGAWDDHCEAMALKAVDLMLKEGNSEENIIKIMGKAGINRKGVKELLRKARS